MPERTPATVLADITSGNLDSIYVVIGEDESEKSALVTALVEKLDLGLRAFNLDRLYGGDDGAGQALLDSARTLPLMTPRRIVLVLQAEKLLFPKRDSAEAQATLEALEGYIAAPEPHTTLVLVADTLDMRRRISRALMQSASVVTCGSVETEDDARRWVREQARLRGVSIEPAAVALLARRNWSDVSRLRADFERVALYASSEGAITLAHVTDSIGPEMLQEQFAIADAISSKDVGRALRELVLLLDEGHPAYMVLGQLRWVAESRMAGSHVRTALDAVLRTDLALKTSAGDHRVLLERLVVELCDDRLRARVRLPALPF